MQGRVGELSRYRDVRVGGIAARKASSALSGLDRTGQDWSGLLVLYICAVDCSAGVWQRDRE